MFWILIMKKNNSIKTSPLGSAGGFGSKLDKSAIFVGLSANLQRCGAT